MARFEQDELVEIYKLDVDDCGVITCTFVDLGTVDYFQLDLMAVATQNGDDIMFELDGLRSKNNSSFSKNFICVKKGFTCTVNEPVNPKPLDTKTLKLNDIVMYKDTDNRWTLGFFKYKRESPGICVSRHLHPQKLEWNDTATEVYDCKYIKHLKKEVRDEQ